MKEYAVELWRRGQTALETARGNMDRKDYDASGSRAYYAAFYAVSAMLAPAQGFAEDRASARGTGSRLSRSQSPP